jgi:hypothetical protein
LTGEASRAETLTAAEHLRGCPDCQQELVSAVVAHASLSSARRFAAAPPAAAEPGDPMPAQLPDMSAVFAQVRDEAAGSHPPMRRRRLLAVAAAAVVVTAGGITIAESVGGSGGSATHSSFALHAFPHGSAAATATVVGPGRMQIEASALPALPAGQFYEIWLTDAARTRMQAVGSFSHDQAQLTVAPNVMANYSAVEVSVQHVGQTDYSGHSVLRGSYG